MKRKNEKRDKAICEEKTAGATLKSISNKYGLSVNRIMQIWSRHLLVQKWIARNADRKDGEPLWDSELREWSKHLSPDYLSELI